MGECVGFAAVYALLEAGRLEAQPSGASPGPPVAVIAEMRGAGVSVSRQRGVWDAARTNQALYAGNLVRTDPYSQAILRYSDLDSVRVAENTVFEIEGKAGAKRGLNLLKGLLYFLHRDKPDQFEVRTPQMSAIIRGTEFVLEVAEDGRSVLSLLDGEVTMSGAGGPLELVSGQQGIAEAGQFLRRASLLEGITVIQWCLYYPAVLNLEELDLSSEEQRLLARPLEAYRLGDLVAARAAYPEGRVPQSHGEQILLAALELALGAVPEAEALLDLVERGPQVDERARALAAALRLLIAAVNGRAGNFPVASDLSTFHLSESYDRQARFELEGALAAARRATEVEPNFAFAWVRVAELEFGFGRSAAALEALAHALPLLPRHAQAQATRGFLLAARNRTGQALEAFDRAIALDPALANGWLGRGLCRIQQGQAAAGRLDLQTAAAVEPNRALLRSYLGKAFSNVGDAPRAERELALAKQLDPRDPTAWLYSALLNQQQNRINESITDLEQSQALNNNRQVYRSRLLLDEDGAVRGANLASVYRDAGMTEVSQREAVRALNLDYANYSAHLFLADSYNQLRDPRQINLRYETSWLSEYLVANLLAPPAAGTLSPLVTQQEYARLFERNRLGLSSATDYSSQGDWRQAVAQYGIYNNSSYVVESLYRTENGYRPNNDLEQLNLSLKLKQQVSPQDSLFFQATYYEAETGDVLPRYDQAQFNPGLRTHETQEPLLLLGAHHQWAPGIDTLFLGGRLEDTFRVQNPDQETLAVQTNDSGAIISVVPFAVDQHYRSDTEIYTTELQQIFDRHPHTLIAGARYQVGDFEVRNRHTVLPGFFDPSEFNPADLDQSGRPDLERITAYGYYGYQPWESLWLIGGVSYDQLTQPDNFRYAPVDNGDNSLDAVSPKAGVIWTPWRGTTWRAAYARSLGGVAFDQSFQLEPSQVAGFIQSYRSLIPEAVAGANGGARFETFGLAWDQRFPTRTYLGITGELLESDVNRDVGVYEHGQADVIFGRSSLRQDLDYREPSLTVTLNQFVGDEWSLGASYRLSHADLDTRFRGVVPGVATVVPPFEAHQDLEATLHQARLFARFNHASGFFGFTEAIWSSQDNDGYTTPLPGDDFWQFNLAVGYRFFQRHAEASAGVLNLTDQNYHLNPLNLTTELPHERLFVTGFRFHF